MARRFGGGSIDAIKNVAVGRIEDPVRVERDVTEGGRRDTEVDERSRWNTDLVEMAVGGGRVDERVAAAPGRAKLGHRAKSVVRRMGAALGGVGTMVVRTGQAVVAAPRFDDAACSRVAAGGGHAISVRGAVGVGAAGAPWLHGGWRSVGRVR
jgi:hypothetical protein